VATSGGGPLQPESPRSAAIAAVMKKLRIR